jgi:hypothetical protein
MRQKSMKPAPPCQAATGPVVWISSPASNRDNTEALPEVQASYLAARFGLDGTRARVVAELAWGR